MSYSLIQLEHFYWVATYSSFAKAASHLDVSKAQVSLSISKLEKSLQLKLLHRTTRSVSLTEAGHKLFPLVEEINTKKKQIKIEVDQLHETPTGLIRITCPNAFAECYLADTLPQFLKQYPGVQIDMRLSSQVLNLETHQIDVAIRLTHEPPQDKVATQLGEYQIGYFASPAYINKNPAITQPLALKRHACLVSATVLKGSTWRFLQNNQHVEIEIDAYLKADNHHIIKQAAIDGLGIACLPTFMIDKQLQQKKLMPILESYWIEAIPIYAVYRQRNTAPLRTSLFIDFLKQL